MNRRGKRFSAIDFQSRAAKLDKAGVGRQMIYVLWRCRGHYAVSSLASGRPYRPGPSPVPPRSRPGPAPVPARSQPGSGLVPAWFRSQPATRLRPGPRPVLRPVCGQAAAGLRPRFPAVPDGRSPSAGSGPRPGSDGIPARVCRAAPDGFGFGSLRALVFASSYRSVRRSSRPGGPIPGRFDSGCATGSGRFPRAVRVRPVTPRSGLDSRNRLLRYPLLPPRLVRELIYRGANDMDCSLPIRSIRNDAAAFRGPPRPGTGPRRTPS